MGREKQPSPRLSYNGNLKIKVVDHGERLRTIRTLMSESKNPSILCDMVRSGVKTLIYLVKQ